MQKWKGSQEKQTQKIAVGLAVDNMFNPNGHSDEEIDIMKEDELDRHFKESASEFHNPKVAETIMRKWYWLGQRSIRDSQPQDINADGVVFCGRCGKKK